MIRMYAATALAALSACAAELHPVTCDVAVVGGGPAGICAAVQSGRAGAATVLLEAAHQVGGTATTGGVNFPGLFHAWGRQVIAGVGWELVTNTVALNDGTLPDFSVPTGTQHSKHQISINIPLFVVLAEDALTRAGVAVHYHAAPTRIEPIAGGWRVTVAAAGDTRVITCRQLVDCTGNGAAAALLGLERLREEECQPGSFVYRIRPNADLAAFDAGGLQALYNAAMQAGALEPYDCRGGLLNYLKAGGNTANYVAGADNSTADARTQTNMRGRAALLRMLLFLRGIPGLENTRLESMSAEVGIRETYRVRGDHLITRKDYVSGRRWEDSVCYAFYPIDLHTLASGVSPAHLREGVVATVPLRALIPKGSRNLLVAGRCLSSDRLANSALRVQATCMATGQAAGAAAALAARLGVTPGELPSDELKALLAAHGGIVPDAFEAIAVEAGETPVTVADAGVTGVRPAVEGTLRKEGATTLTLDDADFPNGAVEVRGGALRLVATNAAQTAAAAPAWVAQTAALWFDANTNAVTLAGGNEVVQWLDAREPDRHAPYLYPRAVRHADDPAPLLAGADPSIHGRPCIDFGGYGSGRWLKWVGPDDARLAPSNILHAFVVFGRQPGFGFLLGDWDWTQAGNAGRKDFHIGDAGSAGAAGAFWNTAHTAPEVRYGRTCVNGVLVRDPSLERPGPGYQLLDVSAAGGACASNFGNDRNFKAGDGGDEVPVDRQGGPRMCEVLVFTNRLDAAERAAVADYLSAKWLERLTRAGTIGMAAGTRVEAEVGGGLTLTAESVCGEGLLVKSGGGTLRLDRDAPMPCGAARLDAGAVESAARREDRAFVVAEGGQALDAAEGTVSRSALDDAGLFRKTGGGTLTLAGVSNAVERIEVAEGTLRLSAPLAPASAVAHAAVPNPGFEEHAAVTANGGKWQTSLEPSGWQLVTNGNGKAGVTLDWAATPWVAADAVPEGGSALFFQYHGGVRTAVQVPREGVYRLSFQAAARYDNASYRQHDFGVWLDEMQVAVAKTYAPVFERFEYATPWLTNGTYELRFQGLVGTVNRSSIIDDVRLEWLDTRLTAGVRNGGFEYSAHLGTDGGTATFGYEPAGAGWTFVSSGGENRCGVAEATPASAPGASFARSVPEGRRCAFVRGGGAIRQTFGFPVTGAVYRMTFQVAARETRERHAFRVLFNGSPVVSRMWSDRPLFKLCEVTLPPVTDWTAEIAFEGLSAQEAGRESLFDDIRVYRADDVPVPNGGFEETSSLAADDDSGYTTVCEGAGWIFEPDADGRKAGISGRNDAFGLPHLGRRMAFLQGQSAIRRIVTLPERGAYALSFQTAARVPPWEGHAFEILWNGRRLGAVATEDAVFRKYTFRLPHAAGAASAELAFRGLEAGAVSSLIDDVRIERLAVGSAAGLLPETAVIGVAAGARLELDFEGALPVAGVTLGGEKKGGTVSAATHPEYVSGPGALAAPSSGTRVLAR